MKLKKLICKQSGHKKGFLHKHNDHYHYVCLRCGDEVVEEVNYEEQKAATVQGMTAKS